MKKIKSVEKSALIVVIKKALGDRSARRFFRAFLQCIQNGSLEVTKRERQGDKIGTASHDIFGTVISIYNSM